MALRHHNRNSAFVLTRLTLLYDVTRLRVHMITQLIIVRSLYQVLYHTFIYGYVVTSDSACSRMCDSKEVCLVLCTFTTEVVGKFWSLE